jgi:hypothetical protein
VNPTGDGTAPAPLTKPTYWITRFLILRLLGLVYLVAFLAFVNQALPLIGHEGLLPADAFVQRALEKLGSRWRCFWELPSVFWFGVSDARLLFVGWIGVAFSALLLAGFANGLTLLVLWALYLSITHVGQLFYGYGWENQLTETGFLAIFLVPVIDPRPFPRRPPPTAVIWLFRWLAFRIMLGAGLIKIRGDPCWRDLTCLDYHFLTQPIPNPLSARFYFAPRLMHRVGVLFNHLVEIVCPFFIFWPRIARHVAGGLMLLFQTTLILSGNLSFLNYLTVVPILACFDDQLLSRLVPRRLVRWITEGPREDRPALSQRIASGALVGAVGILSVAPIANLLSSHQVMNTAHDPFELVNSYGAFGSVGKVRHEIIFEGTRDEELSDTTEWRPYEFKCKPGDPDRRPCVLSPYHLRVDWQIWFAAMESPEENPWAVHLIWKLLHNNAGALSLLAGNPFPEGPPTYIRAQLYDYRFAPTGEHAVWRRTLVGSWLPPLSTDDPRLLRYLAAYRFIPRNGPLPPPDDDAPGDEE